MEGSDREGRGHLHVLRPLLRKDHFTVLGLKKSRVNPANSSKEEELLIPTSSPLITEGHHT